MNYRKVLGMSNSYLLAKGAHKTARAGRCAMEWVAYLAGEPHSDQPACVSPVLKGFCIGLNDALDDAQRQRMRPYLARTIGTAGDGLDETRRWLCVDWMIRTYAPALLDLIPKWQGYASDLRALAEVRDAVSMSAAGQPLARGCEAADAAWAVAVYGSQWAAWDVVKEAGGNAAWDAAKGAGWVTAGEAARTAGGAAAKAGTRGAAREAVWACQDSILRPGGLLDRMLPTELIQVPVAAEWREIVGSRS